MAKYFAIVEIEADSTPTTEQISAPGSRWVQVLDEKEYREHVAKEGENQGRREYFGYVAAVARDFLDEVKAGTIVTTDDAVEWVEQSVDGSEYVIYPGQSLRCLLYSDNHDAAQEFSRLEHAQDPISTMAYFALQEDIVERLKRDGVDYLDPETWPGAGEGEEGGE